MGEHVHTNDAGVLPILGTPAPSPLDFALARRLFVSVGHRPCGGGLFEDVEISKPGFLAVLDLQFVCMYTHCPFYFCLSVFQAKQVLLNFGISAPPRQARDGSCTVDCQAGFFGALRSVCMVSGTRRVVYITAWR